MTTSTYNPVSLSRISNGARNAKGLPPSSLISSGVACLSPKTMQRDKCEVLAILKIDTIVTKKVVFVRAWPLDVVAEGFVALDQNSLTSLGLAPNELLTMPPLMSPRVNKKKGKKKSTPRGRRSSQIEEGYPGTPRNGLQDGYFSGSSSLAVSENMHPGVHPNQPTAPTVCISRYDGVRDAQRVCLGSDTELDFLFSDEFISMVAEELVGRVLTLGTVVSTSAMGKPLNLVVESIKPPADAEVSPSPVFFTRHSRLDILSANTSKPQGPENVGSGTVIGGLDSQLRELKELALSTFQKSGTSHLSGFNDQVSSQSRYQRLVGALLYGPSGTGKTLLAISTAAACSANLEIICGPELRGNLYGEGIQTIKAAFTRARARQPSIVLLDEVDAIAPRRDAPSTDAVQRNLTGTLLAILDDPDNSKLDGVFVVGTTNRPDVIDPALRRAGRFEQEIEVPIPDSVARLEVLKSLTAAAANARKLNVDDVGLEKIASTCYGFVGADLAALWRESVGVALQRQSNPCVCIDDFRKAMKTIRPSGLREVAVEIPFTNWDDIGGIQNAKRRLQEAVEWPLTRKGASLFASIGITPPKGILLYGPPGCSKTLLARAVATESGANFISVKGAELLSKWVGESEKAVRNIFRRARQAAPCVIFFDEIDALASSRSLTAGASAHARVVAQLLAEMDGIDTPGLNARVVVIAATNRPDCLDSAFLRPGRMDVQIYVRLPNEVERLSILHVHTRTTPLAEDVDLNSLASDKSTQGFSGAELAALVREAALTAMQKDIAGASSVCLEDFSTALCRMKPRTPSALVDFFDRYSQATQGLRY